MAALMTELSGRWQAMFVALAGGNDVPPARRLRTEGMMEAAVLLDLASAEELLRAMDACYLAAFGRALAVDFGEDWQDFYPFPLIPAMARRAPVYPSAPTTS
jgi:hypothetical protein